MNLTYKNSQLWRPIFASLFFSVLLFHSTSSAQNYRNARAYMLDFHKNEAFVTNALLSHSKSIADLSSDNRRAQTKEEMIISLNRINTVIANHDQGYDGDFSMNVAFTQLNNKVISLIKSEFMNFRDYKEQSLLSFSEIEKNCKSKDSVLVSLFDEFRNYDKVRSAFARKNQLNVDQKSEKNLFEYNAIMNSIFYKMNLFDEKLLIAINQKNVDEIKACSDKLIEVCHLLNEKNNSYKSYTEDESLLNKNSEVIQFFTNQCNDFIKAAIDFHEFNECFQQTKADFNSGLSSISLEDYTIEIRKYNQLKNRYQDLRVSNATQKSDLINNWYYVNSKFLLNNIDFSSVH